MRLTRLRLRASALAMLVGVMLTSAPAHGGPHSGPSPVCDRREQTTPEGIAAVVPLDSNPPWSKIQQAIDSPSIRGIMVQVRWSDLEPSERQFEWATLDKIFKAAEGSRQWVHLAVFPGFFTPTWALHGVRTRVFNVTYGPEHGTPLPLPMPWDQTYLKRWYTFVRKVAERYGASPAFRMIGAAGPTSESDEMTLPPGQLAAWVAQGYTAKKYLDAWNQTFVEFNADFPNQCVSLSAPNLPMLGPGLPAPGGGSHTAERNAWRPWIVAMAKYVLGERLAIQSNNLHAGQAAIESGDDTDFIISYNGKITTGFMMRGGTEGAVPSAVMGAAGDPPLALQRSIDKGMAPNAAGLHVDYLEIYLGDVTAANMQGVLSKTARRFERAPGN